MPEVSRVYPLLVEQEKVLYEAQAALHEAHDERDRGVRGLLQEALEALAEGEESS